MATPAREPHYTKIPEWVSECGANGMESAVYQNLAKRLHHASGSRKVDPSRARLAADIGLKKPDDVDPYLRALEVLGTIIIHAKKGMRATYELPVWPPEGYDGPENTFAADKWQKDDAAGYKAWRARRRALVDAAEAPYAEKKRARVVKSRARKAAVAESDVPVATGRSSQDHVPVGTGRSLPVVTGTHRPVATGTNQDDQNDQTNMGDGRRPTTGSTPGCGGGSAASGKNEAPVEKASFDSVRRVLAAIPRPLADRLEKEWPQGLPTDITEAISRVIVDEQRTAEQAADRIARRWLAFGYDDDANSQDGRGIDAPLGMLLELLSPSKCWANDARCEDGLNIDSGVVCARCEDEREDRRRAQESAQGGPSGHPVAEAPATAEAPTFTAPAYVPTAREDGKSYGVNVDLAREARQAVLNSKSRMRR